MQNQTARLAFLSLLFVLLTPLAIGKFKNTNTHDARNQVNETIYLDMRIGQPGPVSTSSPLENGKLYMITVSGTWSAWYASTWSNYCGEPEEQPELPSPGVTNGKVGVDARYVFAAPVGYNWCDRGDNPPWLRDNYPFEVSVDGGATWQVAKPVYEDYRMNHRYEYLIVGQGYAPQFRLRDPNVTYDNYGILTITVINPRFLALPFDYNLYDSLALLDTDDGGRLTSWFDHEYPTYKDSPNYPPFTGLRLYTGAIFTNTSVLVDGYPCYARSPGKQFCYDGHNGYDFTYDDPDPSMPGNQPLEILAAADGTVEDVLYSNTGYGNRVVIDHGNGYFTLYGHMNHIYVTDTLTTTVSLGDVIGTMGSSGRSNGTHLHFGVYHDDGDGKWEGEAIDKPVDPLGWKGSSIEPWATKEGPPSYLLWLFDLATETSFDGVAGATVSDPSGNVIVYIPPGTLDGQVTLELSLEPPVAGASGSLRSAGRSVWLQTLDLIGDNQLDILTTLTASNQLTITQPISLAVSYTDTGTLHLNESKIALNYWQENHKSWIPISTTVNVDTNHATATTQKFGHFDLQAPLLCPTDSSEPDDTFYGSTLVMGDGLPISRTFDIQQDEDWFVFEAIAGDDFVIKTLNLATGVDSLVEVYDSDGLTLLASDDNSGEGKASLLNWRTPATGTYFIRMTPVTGSNFGCDSKYELNLKNESSSRVYIPMAIK